MKILKSVFNSPYFLSLIPFIILAFLMQNGLKRYSLKVESTAILKENTSIWFDDLDNDGFSEQIVAFDQNNSTGLAISTVNGIIDQWNFKGNFNFFSKKCLLITGDRDDNGKKEVYAFTLATDSIFLNCISDLKNPVPSIKNRLIDITGNGIRFPDPFIIPGEMQDLDGDGSKELIFGISSGFSIHPRNVYAYYISKDSLVISPESSFFIYHILQADITGDGKKEIMPYGYATSNVSPEKAKYHDCSSFLMVLDQNMKFLFNPIEFKGKYSKITPFVRKTGKGNFLSLLHSSASGQTNSTIYTADLNGTITDTLPLSFYANDCLNVPDGKSKNMLLIHIPDKGLGILDGNLKLIKFLPVEGIDDIVQEDLDMDGKSEILVSNRGTGKISIYREGLTHPVSATISLGAVENTISLKLNKLSDPLIFVQSGRNSYLLKYKENPVYPFYYLLYPGIYLGILGFTLTVRNIQKNQLKKTYDTEKKISQLQLALISNQLDPHFSLNVINSIIYSIEYSDRTLAGEQLRQFASLYRNLLLSASSIQRSIEEELNFCKDYLLLEKMRFKEKLEFKISVPENVNRMTLVPKLLVQQHVENAIKHGLIPLNAGGLLQINLKNMENGLLIEIIDNGIGREMAAKLNNSTTGKGFEIMNELYNIYNKYYNEKVSSEIIDLFHDDGQPAGTKVNIKISRF